MKEERILERRPVFRLAQGSNFKKKIHPPHCAFFLFAFKCTITVKCLIFIWRVNIIKFNINIDILNSSSFLLLRNLYIYIYIYINCNWFLQWRKSLKKNTIGSPLVEMEGMMKIWYCDLVISFLFCLCSG